MTKDDRIAELEAERDALAAALEEYRQYLRDREDVVDSDSGPRPNEAMEHGMAFDEALRKRMADILAARDARMKREGKREALEALPPEAASHLLFPTGLYAQGWNAYRDRVVAALNALEKEARNG